jgi:hypothetical protein
LPKRTLVLSTVVLAWLGAASVVVAQSGDEAAVAQAGETFLNARLKADRSPCEALTAGHLSYGPSAGRVEDKSQCISAAASGPSRWKFITLTDQTIQIVGKNAIVRHTFTGETARDGQSTPVKSGVLMVWHQPDGQWPLLARHAVRLEEPRTH